MNIEKVIVELIAKNNGKWTWYQLERALTSRGSDGTVNAVAEAEALIKVGLLATKLDPAYPAPLYFITKKGLLFLENGL
ncbi:hypothetical protein ACO0K9_02000 [Undibacterium sp. Ji50W]|uniref:hypothetical protein n=1 Tax=Undibacterium sp. Ji50W TaxID=3413041 RepID=UPI003BEFF09F